MAKLTRKCHWCGLNDTHKDEMEFEIIGEHTSQPKRKHYHKHCYPDYLKEEAFKEKEREEMDRLIEVIKEIYGIKEFPRQCYQFIQKLRMGNPVFSSQKNMTKRYREGYEYSLIAETFEYCSETIEYYNRTKKFNGFQGAFMYALVIVIDKIYIVEQRRLDRERQQKMIEKRSGKFEVEDVAYESNYKKPSKSNTNDISNFLDD